MPDRTSLTATEAAVLGLLATRGERSGYDLRKLVEGSVGYFWSPAKSQTYAVLPRLVRQGLLTRRDVEQSQRPDKQLYRITERGERAVREWLAEPVHPEPDRNVLLLKLFFGEYTSPDALLEHVRAYRREAEELRAELDAIEERAAGRERDFYPALTRRYGRAWADAVIGWAVGAERELRLAHVGRR